MRNKNMKLCSACLLGLQCRFDNKSKPHAKIIQLSSREVLIPICPEQLGGLPTPRERAEIQGQKVITENGNDVTEQFEKGAKMVLEIVKILKIKSVILKLNSPSCGCDKIYDGTFSGSLIKGYGITAKLLLENNIKLQSEEDFN
jgi:uncharacterized protein YbbK (DUF523 family)